MFDSANPFPDLDIETVEYELLKSHSEEMDTWLGYRLEEVEAEVRQTVLKTPDREYWTGKSVQTFSTPYLDIFHSLKLAAVGPGDVVADLGCGYGRVGAVVALQFSRVGFFGVEAVSLRLLEAKRVLAQFHFSSSLICADLREFNLSEAKVDGRAATHFFIYDFGSREDFDFVFQALREYASGKSITVIARGGRSRDLIQKTERWLCEVNPPQHFKRFSIYRS
jgi:hypothetical protein